MQNMTLFGGTFDPIHYGHLQVANAVIHELNLEEIFLLPTGLPPHRKEPRASPRHRLNMIEIAISDYPKIKINLHEIHQTSNCYTIDTVKYFKHKQNVSGLNIVIGMDSFTSLYKWHQWQELITYCNIIVIKRPKCDFNLNNKELYKFYQSHHTDKIKSLLNSPNGNIYICKNTPLLDISATKIRKAIKDLSTENNELHKLIPNGVKEYILKNNLYK